MPTAASDLCSPSFARAASAGPVLRTRSGENCLPRLFEISRIVNQVVATWHSSSTLAPQRRWQRVPYERPAVLTPLDDRTGQAEAIHKIIAGRDISPSGFSFTHQAPIACRDVIVTFASEESPWDAVLLRLSWCRFTRSGSYQSGGKFVNPIESPLTEHLLIEDLPYA